MKGKESDALREYVRAKVNRLSDGSSKSGAMLARLRRAVGKRPGSDPETWSEVFSGLPDGLAGRGADPSYGEWAVHSALTLYAVHVQCSDEPAHVPGVRFGDAVGQLSAGYGGSENGNPYQKRMAEAARSADIEVLAWRLRSLIRLLGRAGIGLDYGMLASDLYWFQFESESIHQKVVLAWGRDYARSVYAAKKKSEEAADA